MLAVLDINGLLQRQVLWLDSLGVLEGVLEVKGELGP